MFSPCKKKHANLIYFLKCFYDAHLEELFCYNYPGGSPTHICMQETLLPLLLWSRLYSNDIMRGFYVTDLGKASVTLHPLNEEKILDHF